MLCLMKDNVKEDEKDYKPKTGGAKVRLSFPLAVLYLTACG